MIPRRKELILPLEKYIQIGHMVQTVHIVQLGHMPYVDDIRLVNVLRSSYCYLCMLYLFICNCYRTT